MARIRLEEALALGLIPPDQVASLRERFPAVGRSQMFGSPLFIQPSRGAGALQRNLFGFGPSGGVQSVRFGLGPLLQRLGLSPPPSAVTSPGTVPTGSAARRREELTPEQELALYGQLERAGALPRPTITPNRLRVMGVTPQERQAIQEAAGPTGGDLTKALAIARKAVGVSKQVLDDQSLLRQVVDPIMGLERPAPQRSEDAFQAQRAGERTLPPFVDPAILNTPAYRAELSPSGGGGASASLPDLPVGGGSFAELPGVVAPNSIVDPALFAPRSGVPPASPTREFPPSDLSAPGIGVEPVADAGVTPQSGGGARSIVPGINLVGDLLDLAFGAKGLSEEGGDPARTAVGLSKSGAGALSGATKVFPEVAASVLGSSAEKIGNAAGTAAGALGVGKGLVDVAKGHPEGLFNVGLGGLQLAGTALPGGGSLPFTFPLAIFAMSGAFGKNIQRMTGFGNFEQEKNQAREARMLARDVSVAGPQASAGHRAVFDLGSLSGMPQTDQGKRLQELEHSILTGVNAGPVFSRAGGPNRGTQDIDQLIGLVRARDAMARRGLPSIRGAEGIPPLDPEQWLPRWASYATATGQPRLNLTSRPPQSPEDAGYDPTATSLETLFPTPGRERTGTSEDASGNVSPTYNMPPSIQSAFPAGEFEARALELLRRLSPSFEQSQLAERLGIVPTVASELPPPPGAGAPPPPPGRMLTTPPEEGPGSLLSRAPSMRRGGIVPRTGTYRLHQGETVLPTPGQTGTPKPPANDLYAYLSLNEGGVTWAKKNPDPEKYWRLAFSPYEGREALGVGDTAETPIVVPPNVTRLPGRRLVAAVEAARRAQHQDPIRTLGDFLSPAVGAAPPLFNTLSRGQGVMRDDGQPDEVRDTIVPLVPPPFLRQPPQPRTLGLRESVGVGI